MSAALAIFIALLEKGSERATREPKKLMKNKVRGDMVQILLCRNRSTSDGEMPLRTFYKPEAGVTLTSIFFSPRLTTTGTVVPGLT